MAWMWIAIAFVSALCVAAVLDDNWRMSSGQVPFKRPRWWP